VRKHALGADDESLAVGRDRFEEGGGIGGQILVEQRALVGIEDVQVHAPCMQIDATVILVLLLIKTHDS
jgi:hypothetical protein